MDRNSLYGTVYAQRHRDVLFTGVRSLAEYILVIESAEWFMVLSPYSSINARYMQKVFIYIFFLFILSLSASDFTNRWMIYKMICISKFILCKLICNLNFYLQISKQKYSIIWKPNIFNFLFVQLYKVILLFYY